MEHTQKSYPDKIRGLAEDTDCATIRAEYDYISKRLRALADDLEEWLKHQPSESA